MSHLQKIFWLSLLVKVVIGALLPLTSDEAYYLVWSHHLQWSYFDHPAMIAWLYWLSHPVENFLGLARLPGLLLTHVTIYLWLGIFRHWLDERQRVLWLWLALLSPLLGGSAFVVTPDVPLMLFWALSLYFFFRWTQRPTWQESILLGLSMGMGFSSKYVMVLFPLSLLPLVITTPSFRRSLLVSVPYLLIGGIVGMLPVIYWNSLNEFQSIRFQLDHGLGRPSWKPSWTWEYVLAQLLVIFPLIFYLAIRGAKVAAPVWRYLSFVPLVFFLFTSYRGYVEANWPIVAYPSLFYLAVLGSHGRERLLRTTLIFWGLVFAVLFFFALNPRLAPIQNTKLRDFYQFDDIARKTKDIFPLYGRSYQMAATLQHRQQRPIFKLPGMNRKDFYDSIEAAKVSGELFFVLVEKGDRLPEIYQSQGYAIVERQPLDDPFELWRVELKK